MNDLRSHWNYLAIFALIAVQLGCQALDGTPRPVASDDALLPSSPQVDFGTVVVGARRTLSQTVLNRTSSTVILSKAMVRGSGFAVVAPTFPVTIAAHRAINFTVRFTPRGTGAPSGSVVLLNSAARTVATIALSGKAIAAGRLAASPVSLSFGNVPVGGTQTRRQTFINTGASALTISEAALSNSAFRLSGLTLPLTLPAGKSVNFGVVFSPRTLGTATGAIYISGRISLSASTTGAGSLPSRMKVPLSGIGSGAGKLAAPANVNFGTSRVGSAVTKPVVVSNSGTAPVTVSQATVSGRGFRLSGLTTPVRLAVGQRHSLNVVFSPTSAGAVNGILSIASDATNEQVSVPLAAAATASATAATVIANPPALSFGSVQVGGNKTQSETLTNSGGSDVTISQAAVSGTAFSLGGLQLPLKLESGKSFTFDVTFSPKTGGNASGSISFTSDASSAIPSIPLSATGGAAGLLSMVPGNLSFGSVVVGTSRNLVATLQASGSSVTISGASLSSPEFSVSGVSFPITLTTGQRASLTVRFTPRTSGEASGSLSLASNASNPSVTGSLTGTGMAAPQHSVDLTWGPSTSTVVGYNVYRGSQSGGPYSRLNSAPEASTSFTDNSVQGGRTYYYVATAVDQGGAESEFSNEVQAPVPTP